jgi:hypothetical protein
VSYFVDRMGERTHQRSVSKAGPVRPARWGSAALASPKAALCQRQEPIGSIARNAPFE